MTFKFYVDWQDNNNFTDSIDDISADVIDASWQLGMRKAFQDVSDGASATLTLDNSSAKYTPENASSPIYGYLLPQRRIKIVDNTGGSDRVMFVGWLEFPSVDWILAGQNTAKVTATLIGNGAKSLVSKLEPLLPQYTNVTADTIILDILKQTQLTPALSGLWLLGIETASELGQTTVLGSISNFSNLETGLTTFPNYGDKQTTDGWTVIREVTVSERGRFFFDREGIGVFWNRHHTLLDTTNDGTVTLTSNPPRNIKYAYGDLISNYIQVNANPRQTSSSETLWELDRAVTVAAGGDEQFNIRLRKANGQFAGASNLSGTATFTQGTAIVTIAPKGGKATVSIMNSDTTQPAILSGYTVVGSPTVQQNELSAVSFDTASIGLYGKHALTISLSAIEDYADIKSISNFELTRRKSPVGNIQSIDFINSANGTANAHQLEWQIGTRVNANISTLSHNNDYFIIGERHKWYENIHQTTFYTEPAELHKFWILGQSGYGELGQATYLGY